MKKAIYKVPQGKLLKIFLSDSSSTIVKIQITGDFFTYPEENIELLEKDLEGIPLTADSLEQAIKKFLEKNPTVFYGLDVPSLISTILSAHGNPTN